MEACDVYLFNRTMDLTHTIPVDQLITHSQKAELNRLITAEFSCKYTKEREEVVYFGHRDIDDQSIFHIYTVTSCTSENGILYTEGVHIFFDEMAASGYMNETQAGTAEYILGKLLLETHWDVGVCDTDYAGECIWDFISALEAFWIFVEECGIEFLPRIVFENGEIINSYIDVAEQLSEDKGKWYEYNDKLLSVTKISVYQDVYTAAVGLGADAIDEGTGEDIGRTRFDGETWTTSSGDPVNKPYGQEWLEIPAASELYGFWDGGARFGIIEFSDCTDPAELLQLTYDKLTTMCYPKENFKATVYAGEPVELGETITIVRDDLGIRYKTRVFKITRNFLMRKDREFEFGEAIVENPWQKEDEIERELHKHRRKHRKLENRCNYKFSDHDGRLGNHDDRLWALENP